MDVRKMCLADVTRVLDIEQHSFLTPWSREAFLQELETNRLAQYYVIEDETGVQGYMGCWCVIDEAHITNIAIHPDARGKGYGKRLVQYVLDALSAQGIQRATLEVRVSNVEAKGLYAGFGFQTVGIRPGYYRDTSEDAEIMWLAFAEGKDFNGGEA